MEPGKLIVFTQHSVCEPKLLLSARLQHAHSVVFSLHTHTHTQNTIRNSCKGAKNVMCEASTHSQSWGKEKNFVTPELLGINHLKSLFHDTFLLTLVLLRMDKRFVDTVNIYHKTIMHLNLQKYFIFMVPKSNTSDAIRKMCRRLLGNVKNS